MQDIKTGALGYKAVTVVHHNPPSPTFLVKVGGDKIVGSRFTDSGSLARVGSWPATSRLDVAGDHDFFAGASAALVHDVSLPETRLDPLDAAPELARAR